MPQWYAHHNNNNNTNKQTSQAHTQTAINLAPLFACQIVLSVYNNVCLSSSRRQLFFCCFSYVGQWNSDIINSDLMTSAYSGLFVLQCVKVIEIEVLFHGFSCHCVPHVRAYVHCAVYLIQCSDQQSLKCMHSYMCVCWPSDIMKMAKSCVLTCEHRLSLYREKLIKVIRSVLYTS